MSSPSLMARAPRCGPVIASLLIFWAFTITPSVSAGRSLFAAGMWKKPRAVCSNNPHLPFRESAKKCFYLTMVQLDIILNIIVLGLYAGGQQAAAPSACAQLQGGSDPCFPGKCQGKSSSEFSCTCPSGYKLAASNKKCGRSRTHNVPGANVWMVCS